MSESPVLETNFLEKKSHCQNGFGMSFDELISGTWSAFGTGVVVVTFEDSFHSDFTDIVNAKFLEFPCDSSPKSHYQQRLSTTSPSVFGSQL